MVETLLYNLVVGMTYLVVGMTYLVVGMTYLYCLALFSFNANCVIHNLFLFISDNLNVYSL